MAVNVHRMMVSAAAYERNKVACIPQNEDSKGCIDLKHSVFSNMLVREE